MDENRMRKECTTADLALSAGNQLVPGRFAQMVANSATAAICADTDNVITSWNSAAERLFGHSACDVVGKLLWIIVPPRHREAHAAAFDRAAREGCAKFTGGSSEILGLHAS